MSLEDALRPLIEAEVKRQIDEQLPVMIRALGIREAEPESEGYVDALEVAKLLGRNLSTPGNILKAKRYVYDLARQRKIPSVRLGERSIKFDLAKVKEALAKKELKAA